MNLQQLTQKVATLTQQVQQVQNLAKTIGELPVQSELDPASTLHVSRNGISERLNVQKIIDAVSNLDYDRVLNIGEIIRDGNNFTVPADANWKIAGTLATNIVPFEFELLPAPEGFGRIDLLIVRLEGFEIITGTHSQDIYFAPDIPNESNSILIKEYKIEGNSIGDAGPVVNGNPYIQKNQFNEVGDTNGKFHLRAQSNYIIVNPAITEIKGICDPLDNEQNLYPGKLHYWTNILATSVWLRHIDTSDPEIKYPFYLPGEVDYELKPGACVLFQMSNPNIPMPFEIGYLRFMAGSIAPAAAVVSKPQKTVIENTTVDNSFNGCIVKVKASATIIIPSGLVKGFEFDCATFAGATATLVQDDGVTLNSPSGLILHENLMLTLFNDAINTYEIRGDQTES